MEAVHPSGSSQKTSFSVIKAALWLTWAVALAAVIYQLVSYQKGSGGRSETSQVASIVERTGDVSYRKASDFDWLSARAISNLFENELFSTGEESKAKLSLGNNLYLDLEANTVIKLDPPKGLGGDTEIFLVSGDLKVDVGDNPEIGKPERKVVIKAGGTTFEVKGQGSSLRLKKDKDTEKVAVTATTGNIQSVVGDRKVAVTKPREMIEKVATADASRVLNIPVELATSQTIVAKAAIEEVPLPKAPDIDDTPPPPPPPPAAPPVPVAKVEVPVPIIEVPAPKVEVPAPKVVVPVAKEPVKLKPEVKKEEKVVVKPKASYRLRVFEVAKKLPGVNTLVKNPNIQVEYAGAVMAGAMGVFATDGKTILAEVVGGSSGKEMDAIRTALNARVVFRGKSDSFLKPEEIAKFSTMDKKGLFLQSGKRVLPISEDLANSFADFGAMITAQKTMVFRAKVEVLSP